MITITQCEESGKPGSVKEISVPFHQDVSAVLGFLADQFEEDKQYRSLNCYRSALSSTHLTIEGFPVGHPLVARLLKGAFNCRPPVPRYENTWDIKSSHFFNHLALMMP